MQGYQSNYPMFHNNRHCYVFLTPNNYVFVPPLLHLLHRRYRLFIGSSESMNNDLQYSPLQFNMHFVTIPNFPRYQCSLCLAPLFLSPCKWLIFSGFVLSFFVLLLICYVFHLSSSKGLLPFDTNTIDVSPQKTQAQIYKIFFNGFLPILKTTRARINHFYVRNYF